MPWIGNNSGEDIHVWTREPHYDTPALCGEWKRDKHARQPKDKTLSLTWEDWLDNHAESGVMCPECLERARELYF